MDDRAAAGGAAVAADAGSTGGGIKVSRIVILVKTIIKELNSYIHPKSIRKIKIKIDTQYLAIIYLILYLS